jgi:hypothetical protein
VLRHPEDEVISLFAGLLANPDMTLSRDIFEIQDYVFSTHGEDDRLPPRTLVMDVTVTYYRYERTTQHTNGALTHRVSSTYI